MKSNSLLPLTMLFLIPAFAFAGQRNSATVQLPGPVQVAGTELASGQYKMMWEGNGSDVTVSFLDGKKTVATAPAKLVSKPNNEEAIETVTEPGNTQVLQAVDLKNLSVRFENTAPSTGN